MKSIEEELSGPYGALDKALDRVEKTFTKFVHGMSPEQRDAAVAFLVQRVQATAEAMQRAGQARTPFSFAAAQRAPQALQDMTPRPAILHDVDNANVRERQITTIRPEPSRPPVLPYSNGVEPAAPGLPPRPIGRIADDSTDPLAGEILVAPPIRSPLVKNLDPGTGFVNPTNDKGDLV